MGCPLYSIDLKAHHEPSMLAMEEQEEYEEEWKEIQKLGTNRKPKSYTALLRTKCCSSPHGRC